MILYGFPLHGAEGYHFGVNTHICDKIGAIAVQRVTYDGLLALLLKIFDTRSELNHFIRFPESAVSRP